MIKANTLFEFTDEYTKLTGHKGRFKTSGLLFKAGQLFQYGARTSTYGFDVWTVIKYPNGEICRFTEEDIFAAATELPFQEGQAWVYTAKTFSPKPLTLTRCEEGPNGGYRWEAVNEFGRSAIINESDLLKNFTRVDGLDAAPAAKRRETNGSCNRCGSPAMIILDVECSNPKCVKFRP